MLESCHTNTTTTKTLVTYVNSHRHAKKLKVHKTPLKGIFFDRNISFKEVSLCLRTHTASTHTYSHLHQICLHSPFHPDLSHLHQIRPCNPFHTLSHLHWICPRSPFHPHLQSSPSDPSTLSHLHQVRPHSPFHQDLFIFTGSIHAVHFTKTYSHLHRIRPCNPFHPDLQSSSLNPSVQSLSPTLGHLHRIHPHSPFHQDLQSSSPDLSTQSLSPTLSHLHWIHPCTLSPRLTVRFIFIRSVHAVPFTHT